MNQSHESQVLMSVSYASRRETRTNSTYRWNSAERGIVPFVILQTTLMGEGVFQLAGRSYGIPPGFAFIVLVPENSEYRYPPSATEPWTFSWVNFYGDLSLRLWRVLRDAFGPVIPIPPDSPAGLALARLIRDVSERRFKDRFEAGQEAYAFYVRLWRQLARPQEAAQGKVASAIQYCHEHLQEPISVKELAAQAGLSREHFSRAFHQEQGISPGAFLRQQRLRNARQLLGTTMVPIHEIALRCGFFSAHHFRLTFRRAYRCSPQQFRVAAGRRRVSHKTGGPRPERVSSRAAGRLATTRRKQIGCCAHEKGRL